MSDQPAGATPASEVSGELSRRLWRLRKRHHYVDAELYGVAGAADVELRYLYDGEKAYQRRWANRALAVSDAAQKRADLEREGWVFHW